MTTLAELLVPLSTADVRTTLLGLLETVGFPTSSWKATSVPILLIDATSELVADLSLKVSLLARGGFSELAQDEWLTLRSRSQYEHEREAATATIGTLTLTDGGGGPYVIAAGSLVAVSTTGLRYRNSTGGTLLLNDTLDLEFTSVAVGEAYNVAGGTITELETPLAGVTIAAAADWITTAGSDGESDARLRARNAAKWATLATGSPAAAWIAWILDGVPGVSKVAVRDDNPLGDMTVQIVLATASGPASAADVAAAQVIIDAREPIGSQIEAIAASPLAITVTGTVYVRAAQRSSAEAAVVAAFADLTEELDMGETVYTSKLIDVIHTSSGGVRNVVLTAPAADVTLLPTEIAVFTLDLTWSSV